MFIKKMNKAVILLALLSISAFAQGTFTDSRDGKKYKTVKIGKQTWMAQNLDYHGEDGKLGVCHNNKPESCEKSGRLYDWATAMNIDTTFNNKTWNSSAVKHQGICPSGWHLPDTTEWRTLVNFAGGEKVAGKKLKAKSGWTYGSTKGNNGTDNYGFSALPGGSGYPDGRFSGISEFSGNLSSWWNANDYNGNEGYYWNTCSNPGSHCEGIYKARLKKGLFLLSVRCIQD